MSKLIIKNCPAIIEYKNMYLCAELNNLDDLKQFCEDCTDCVMKQIYKECKDETEIDISFRGDLAERILDLLNIQEVE